MDSRGQIVIPKDIRNELGISSGSGFWMFSVEKEGIFLKKIETPDFEDKTTDSLKTNAKKINVDVKNFEKASESYKKGKGGRLDVI